MAKCIGVYIILYFNPRSPCGERHVAQHQERHAECISIHAPRAGSDLEAERKADEWLEFQSTLPVRGATEERINAINGTKEFQSTLPVRGATRTRL